MKIDIKATGVNRADVFYRQGKYPVFGVEIAGIAADGKRYMAVVDGGGYEKSVDVEDGSYLEIPENLSFTEGAAIVEGLYTYYYNLVLLGNLKEGETVLLHGAGGGIGPIGVQLARLLGAEVYATAGTPEKRALIEKFGGRAIDYKTEELGKEKFDVIVDVVGADYFNKNLVALKKNGRLCIISFISGAKTEAALGQLLIKNLSVYGSTIRSLDQTTKKKIRDGIKDFVPRIKPVMDKVFKLSEVNKALDYVEKYKNVGKVVVEA